MWAHSTNLVWAVNIVPTCNDDGELKTAVVGLDEEFSGGLGRRVWVCRLEHVLLQHDFTAVRHSLAVNFICAHMNKALDAVKLGGLEQHVGAEHIVLRERERVAERVVDVGLRRKVEHSVDTL